jgi:hypothetical protein
VRVASDARTPRRGGPSFACVNAYPVVLTGLAAFRVVAKARVILKSGSEKFSNSAKSGYNKGTIRADIGYLVVSRDVRRHRLISISYISHGPCHGRGREFESRRPRHSK